MAHSDEFNVEMAEKVHKLVSVVSPFDQLTLSKLNRSEELIVANWFNRDSFDYISVSVT